uniref:SMAD6 protein n=1 Tax=Isodiametra pulchra TaxID=504439 RepID=A0A2P1DVB5_ISOPU|nr:SMAD6 protein [Isodiametra pulchra]
MLGSRACRSKLHDKIWRERKTMKRRPDEDSERRRQLFDQILSRLPLSVVEQIHACCTCDKSIPQLNPATSPCISAHDLSPPVKVHPFTCCCFGNRQPKDPPSSDLCYFWLCFLLSVLRYPDLDLDNTCAIKQSPLCHWKARRSKSSESSETSSQPERQLCFNPWHWSLVKESPRELDDTCLKGAEYRGPVPRPPFNSLQPGWETEEPLSVQGDAGNSDHAWCHLAFWEERCRVGSLQQGSKSAIFITNRQSNSISERASVVFLNDLTSKTAANNNFLPSNPTRERVSTGICLWRDPGGSIWLFNFDNLPVFVDSPSLYNAEKLDVRSTPAVRIGGGQCCRVFQVDAFRRLCCLVEGRALPIDPYSIRVSLAKGFGEGYSRTHITSCPIWFEVLLNRSIQP